MFNSEPDPARQAVGIDYFQEITLHPSLTCLAPFIWVQVGGQYGDLDLLIDTQHPPANVHAVCLFHLGVDEHQIWAKRPNFPDSRFTVGCRANYL